MLSYVRHNLRRVFNGEKNFKIFTFNVMENDKKTRNRIHNKDFIKLQLLERNTNWFQENNRFNFAIGHYDQYVDYMRD
jgi:hypothetical protein